MLAIFQKAIMKPYFDAGLQKQLGIQHLQYRLVVSSNEHITILWRHGRLYFRLCSIYMFMENTSHDPIAESVKQQLLDSQSPQV